MAAERPPYLNAHGNITKALKRIKTAATPPRFTHDFLGTKLQLTGGSARPLVPFLKRTGFLGTDGVPTDLYKRFRNPGESGSAAAEALKHGYRQLYEVNEYIHDASDKDLKGVVVQVTGVEPTSSTVKGVVGSFKALRAFAVFDGDVSDAPDTDQKNTEPVATEPWAPQIRRTTPLGLSYTINLHLPPTSDIAVFDAIFKSLNEHLLK